VVVHFDLAVGSLLRCRYAFDVAVSGPGFMCLLLPPFALSAESRCVFRQAESGFLNSCGPASAVRGSVCDAAAGIAPGWLDSVFGAPRFYRSGRGYDLRYVGPYCFAVVVLFGCSGCGCGFVRMRSLLLVCVGRLIRAPRRVVSGRLSWTSGPFVE